MTDRAITLAKQGYQHENRDTKTGAKELATKLRAQGYEAVIMMDSIRDHSKGRTVYFWEVWYRRK